VKALIRDTSGSIVRKFKVKGLPGVGTLPGKRKLSTAATRFLRRQARKSLK